MDCPTPDSPPDIPSVGTELPIAVTNPQRQRSRRPSWLCAVGRLQERTRGRSHHCRHRDGCQHAISFFSKIWEKEEVPAQWKEEIIIKLKKKNGDLRDCSNYRGIMLLSKQVSQQGSTGEDEGGCRPQAPRPAGRLPAEQIFLPTRSPACASSWNSH